MNRSNQATFWGVFFFSFIFSVPTFAADLPLYQQTLTDAEHQAKESSGTLKSVSSSVESAQAQEKSVSAALLPNLSLQGDYFYQTEVPSFTLGPLGTLQFGTHNNFAIGPVLSYTLFDGGKDRENAKSADLLAESRRSSYEAQEKQLELNVRQNYFRVQYALKELALTADSLRLSQAQSHDIDLRYRAGASSRLDQTQSHRDVLSYQLKFRQAQNDLASSLRELAALTQPDTHLDTGRPVPQELDGNLPDGVEAPSLLIRLDAISQSLGDFGNSGVKSIAGDGPSSDHPELQTLTVQAESSRMAAESEKSGLWPKIGLQARSQYLYPNVVIPQTAFQNTFMATLTFPLFEGDASRSLALEKEKDALAADYQKQQKQTDLSRDYFKAYDFLMNLRSQQKISNQNVQEAKEVSRLTFQSYKAGKSRYLDVQDANVKLLEAEVSSAQIESSILSVTATIVYLQSRSTEGKQASN